MGARGHKRTEFGYSAEFHYCYIPLTSCINFQDGESFVLPSSASLAMLQNIRDQLQSERSKVPNLTAAPAPQSQAAPRPISQQLPAPAPSGPPASSSAGASGPSSQLLMVGICCL